MPLGSSSTFKLFGQGQEPLLDRGQEPAIAGLPVGKASGAFSGFSVVLPPGLQSFASAKPAKLERYFLIALAAHVLLIVLAALVFLLFEFFGWNLPLFDALKLPDKNVEFIIVEAPPKQPRDPKTKLRADRASRSGGQKTKTLKPAPNLKAAGAPTQNKAVSKPAPPTPRRTTNQQQSPKPSPQPSPRPAPRQSVSKPTPAPPTPQPPTPNPTPKVSRAPSPPPPKVIRRTTSSTVPTPSPVPSAISAPPLPPPKTPGTGKSGGGPIGSKLAGLASGSAGGGSSGSSGPKALPGSLSSPNGGSGFGSGGRNSIDQFGSAGGGGGPDGVDALPDVDFGPYISELQRRIKRNWVPPADNRDKRIVAVFTVRRDGRLVDIKLKTSSGVAIADQAAIQAIRVSAPFRPLPPSFRGQTVDVLFTFDYNVLSGRSL